MEYTVHVQVQCTTVVYLVLELLVLLQHMQSLFECLCVCACLWVLEMKIVFGLCYKVQWFNNGFNGFLYPNSFRYSNAILSYV